MRLCWQREGRRTVNSNGCGSSWILQNGRMFVSCEQQRFQQDFAGGNVDLQVYGFDNFGAVDHASCRYWFVQRECWKRPQMFRQWLRRQSLPRRWRQPQHCCRLLPHFVESSLARCTRHLSHSLRSSTGRPHRTAPNSSSWPCQHSFLLMRRRCSQ